MSLSKGIGLDEIQVFLNDLASRLRKKAILERLLGIKVYRFIFGSIYSVSDFESALKQKLGETADFLPDVLGNKMPKYLVLSAETKTGLEPVVIGNYPAGKRNKPIVKPFLKLWEAARATSSTPPIFEPFEIGKRKGGIWESLMVDLL